MTPATEAASRVGYAPREAAKSAGVTGTTDTLGFRTPAEFDDLIEATGG